jgi:hypothetical protein
MGMWVFGKYISKGLNWIWMIGMMMNPLFAQEENQEELESLLLEWHSEKENEEELLIEEDLSTLNYPILQINTATFQELLQFNFLNPLQVSDIITYRKLNGPFISIYELQSIESLDDRSLRLLIPFVKVAVPSTLRVMSDQKQLLSQFNHDWMIRYGRRVEKLKGYLVNKDGLIPYDGSPDRLIVRYRLQWNDGLRFALNLKKDPGEAFFGPTQKMGFDYFGAALTLRNQGRLQTLVIGDFGLQWGQGLQMWIGPAFGKGAIIHGPIRTGQSVNPYTSTREIGFLRGIASQWKFNKISISPFASYRLLDASVGSTPSQPKIVESIGSSGLHRTSTELQNRSQLGQWVYGVHGAWQNNKTQWGAAFHQHYYSIPLEPADILRHVYALNGQYATYWSVHGHQQYKNQYYFGEWSLLREQGHAWSIGMMSAFGKAFSSLFVLRQFQAGHQSMFSQPMAENNLASNELGMYSGFSIQLNRHSEWMLYVDLFQFPWLKYRIDAPSRGSDVFSQLHYRWNRKFQMTARIRWKQTEQNRLNQFNDRILVDLTKLQWRWDMQWTPQDAWQWRMRIANQHYFEQNRKGMQAYLSYIDLFYKPTQHSLSGNIRLAYFYSPHVETRFYAFESDVLYGNTMPVYDQKGWRSYINLRWKIRRGIDIWAKYGVFYYPELKSIGSGNESVESSFKNEIKLQTRWKF